MKLKSYFSGTVEAAMDLARQELGEEALLVNARPSTPETRYLGAYEVVFGIPPRRAAAISQRQTDDGLIPADFSGAGASQEISTQNHLAQEVAGLKRDLERMMQSFLETRIGPPGLPAPSAPAPEEPRYEADSTLGRPGAARAIVALVGPPGAGRTTTLIKLAARYGLTGRKSAQILSADVFRIAAADQIRSLASILGIGCDVAETAGALAQMLEEHRSKELIFVDTPGLARGDMEDASDLAELIASHPEIDAHLVLPGFMRPDDMARLIDRFAVFGPRKLLFTHMDETSNPADLVREAARRALPISFLGTGQQIPDDLEPADRSRLAEWIMGDSARSLGDSPKKGPARMRGAAA